MPPAIESVIAFIRLPSFTKRIRPPYSPMRFGVFKESVTPHKTDLYAVMKLIGCKVFISNCHLRASMPQFTNTKAITSQNFQACGPKGMAFIKVMELSISGCAFTCWYNDQKSHKASAGPITHLINILILLFTTQC